MKNTIPSSQCTRNHNRKALFCQDCCNLKISFSIWGLIAIIILIVFVLKLFNGLRKGMKPGIAKQTIDTICKITIPIIVFIFTFDWMSSFAEEFTQFLIVLVICETIAGVVNPLPQWCFENNIDMTTGILKEIMSSLGFTKK